MDTKELKEKLLDCALLQECKVLKNRDSWIAKGKNPKDSKLFNYYVGGLMGMITMLEEVGMEKDAKQFDWIFENYGI